MTWDRYDDLPVHYWTCETCGDQMVLDALTHTCADADDPAEHDAGDHPAVERAIP